MTLRTAQCALLLTAIIALSSCVDKPLSTDVVRDDSAAIEIAKKTDCKFSDDSSRKWTAWLHDGVWDVRQYSPGRSGACGWHGVKIRASDGDTADRCEACF
jgi:hypothetical protein